MYNQVSFDEYCDPDDFLIGKNNLLPPREYLICIKLQGYKLIYYNMLVYQSQLSTTYS